MIQATGRIEFDGPLIGVTVSNLPAWEAMMVRDGSSTGIGLPRPIKGLAMVDTGASTTVVGPRVADSLRAMLGSPVRMLGLHAETPWALAPAAWVRTVRVNVKIDGLREAIGVEAAVMPLDVLKSDDGLDVVAIVGRDLLERLVLTYDGPARRFTLLPGEASDGGTTGTTP